MALDPLEMDIWRRAMAGEQVDTSALFNEPEPSLDPSAGLPPGAVAGPAMLPMERDVGAETAARDAAVAGQTDPQVMSPQAAQEAAVQQGLDEEMRRQMGGQTQLGAGYGQAAAGIGEAIGAYRPPPAGPTPGERMGTTELVPLQAPGAAGAQGKRPAGAGGSPVPPGAGPDWLRREMARERIAEQKRDPAEPLLTPYKRGELAEIEFGETKQFERSVEQQELAMERQQEEARKAVEFQAAQERAQLAEAERQREKLERLRLMEQNAREMADAAVAEPIDSDRLWNSKSTGEKVMQKIAIALGALGTAQGGPNVAMQMIQADIDRDVAAQVENRKGKMARVAQEGQFIDMARQRFETDDQIEAATREAAYKRTLAELEQWRTAKLRPEQELALDQMAGSLQEQISELERQRRMTNENFVVQMQLARLKALQAQQAARAAKKPDDKYFVPGWGYARPDPKALEGARGAAIAAKEALAALDELERLRSSGGAKQGAFGVGSPGYHKAQTLRGKVVANTAKVFASGFNPSAQQEEKAEAMVPDPSSWGSSSYEGQSSALRDMVKQTTDANMDQFIQHKTPPGWKPEGER